MYVLHICVVIEYRAAIEIPLKNGDDGCDFLFIERQSVFLFFIPKNNNRWKFLAGSLVPSKLGIRGLLPYFLLRWNCLRLKQFINSDRIDVEE